MRVAAALCWFDEPVELLDRCVRSLAPFVDKLVAVDGAWRLWDSPAYLSSQEQLVAVLDAAVGIDDVEVIREPMGWESQVEKRTAAIAAATVGADWVFPLDADWTFHGNPDHFRRELERATGDAGIVRFHTPEGTADSKHFHQWHQRMRGTTEFLPIVFRALPNLRVERNHWTYTADKDGGRVCLWGSSGDRPAERFQVEGMRVEHHCFERTPERAMANRDYVNRREALVPVLGYEP